MATYGEAEENPPHQIDQLEQAFKNCIEQLSSQEHFNTSDTEENRVGIEQSVQKFIDLARQTESFFLNKRLVLSTQKPEQILKEDIQELKAELDRKEKLIEKHHERLQQWQNLLHSMPGSGGSQSTGQSHLPPPPQGPPPPHPGMMHVQQQQPPAQMNQFTVPGPPPSGPQPFVMPPPHQPQTSYPTPLAYLEQNLSNIGMPDRR
ncbi:hypothetical protein SNE40_007940 [Patella caerulea]|uniref:Mediator of RNA polymerase II transcription subunit 28 n=1 Tax=Patella caerulea TaxID=87958 RepID=A0AAN8PUF3_PATCE